MKRIREAVNDVIAILKKKKKKKKNCFVIFVPSFLPELCSC